MKKFLTFPVLCAVFGVLYSGAAAADQRLNLNIPGGGAADLLNMTTVPSDISDSNPDMSVTRSCTTRYGRVIREHEPGYNNCMAHLEGTAPKPSPIPSDR